MRSTKLLSAVFSILAVVLMLCTILLCFGFLNAPTLLLLPTEDAEVQADALMEAFCRGDYSAVSGVMYGQPDLGTDQVSSDDLSRVLWEAFRSSISYEFTGACYASAYGVSIDATITALDISDAMPLIKERLQLLLDQRAMRPENASGIYDEKGNYQESFVMDVLHEAVNQVMQEGSTFSTWKISLELVYQDGQWWVIPKQDLISFFSGAITQ